MTSPDNVRPQQAAHPDPIAAVIKLTSESRPTTVMVTHSVEEAVLLADRIIVFTERPGRIRMDMAVPFPRPRPSELMRTPEFHHLADELTTGLSPA